MTKTVYTMIHRGKPAWQFSTGADVTFEVDADGVILGAHCWDDADWVSEIIKLLIGGRLRLEVDGEGSDDRDDQRVPG